MSVDYRDSLITSLSCWVAVVAALALHLGNPWWAAISAWIISHPDTAVSWNKGLMRIFGTILGCILGYQLAVQVESSTVAQVAALFLLSAGGTYMRFTSAYGYAWFMGAVSALILLCVSLTAQGSLSEMAQNRAFEIVCGVISAMLCQIVMGWLLRRAVPAMPLARPLPATPSGDRREFAQLALVGGVMAMIMPMVWATFELPNVMAQSMVSALILLDRDVTASHFKGRLRFLGCLAGGIAGLLAIAFSGESFFLWSGSFLIGLGAFSRLHLSTHRWAYFGTQGGIAFVMALVTGSGPPDTILPVINRICGILLGVALMVAVARVVGLFAQACGTPQAQAAPVTGAAGS